MYKSIYDGIKNAPLFICKDEVPIDPNAETVFERIRKAHENMVKPKQKLTSYPADQNPTENK